MKSKAILSIFLTVGYLSINTTNSINVFSMEENNVEDKQIIENNFGNEKEEKKEITNNLYSFPKEFWDDIKKSTNKIHNDRSAEVEETRDLYKKSASFCYEKEDKDKESKPLLSINGGGIRGLFPALFLSIIEEYINHANNKEFKASILKTKQENDRWLRINDIFEAGAGTSIGSILITYIFSKEVYAEGAEKPTPPKMVDALKILLRYGYKIFDENKNIDPSNVLQAQFSNNGLKTILNLIFGDQTLENGLLKPVYIPALNETNSNKFTFKNGHTYTKTNACLASSAAQTYFPRVEIIMGNEKIQLSDGGFIENNPSHSLYLEEKSTKENKNKFIKIFSFGTGENDNQFFKEKIRTTNGLFSIGNIINCALTSQEKKANEDLLLEMQDSNSRLASLFYITPQMIGESYDLSDCSHSSIKAMFYDAAQVARAPVFVKMLQSLGLQCPNDKKMKELVTLVKRKALAFSNSDYDQLTKLEKEYIQRTLTLVDFDIYEYASYINEKNEPQLMTQQQTEKVKEAFFKSLSAQREGTYSYIKSFYTNNTNLRDQFNSAWNFNLISMKDTSHFLNNQSILLFENKLENFDIKSFIQWNNEHGESNKISYFNEENKQAETAVQKALNLCAYFIECCNQIEVETKRDDSLDFISNIFWRNCLASLKDMDKESFKNCLNNLYKAMNYIIQNLKSSRSYVPFITVFRKSRLDNLLNALEKYISEFDDKSTQSNSSNCHIL